MTAAMDEFLLENNGWTRDPDDADVAWKLVRAVEQEDHYNMWWMASVITQGDETPRVGQELVYYYGIWTGEWIVPVYPPLPPM